MNAAIAGADETTSQLANFPTVLLTGFMAGLIEEVDARRLGHAAGQARAWAGALELIIIVLVLTVLARVISSRSRLTK